MRPYISPFDVRDSILNWGKAYAFWAIRDEVGVIHSLYLMWVAINMIKHENERYAPTSSAFD